MASSRLMKAARFHPEDLSIRLEESPIPEIDEDEILVKTIAAGLCHSDLMLVDGSAPVIPDKIVTIGHEAVGKVVDFGSKVTGFRKGDHIGYLNAHRACWDCSGCAIHYLWCERGDMQMQGYSLDGFLQEYVAVDYRAATVLPEGMDATKAAPLCCAGITAYNAVLKSELQKDQWLVIVGCGGLGQMGIRYARAMGLRVIAVDVDDDVLNVAKQAGVLHAFNSRTNPGFVSEIRDITGKGADAAIVFTAVKAGYDIAPKVLRTGGKLIVVGCPPTDIALNALDISLGKYSVHGASNHATPKMLRDCAEFTNLHGIECPQRVFDIDEIGNMIDIMQTGRMGGTRLVVNFKM